MKVPYNHSFSKWVVQDRDIETVGIVPTAEAQTIVKEQRTEFLSSFTNIGFLLWKEQRTAFLSSDIRLLTVLPLGTY